MPIPFEQSPLNDLQQWSKETFRSEARKMNVSDRVGDLAHFLVKNYPNECSPSEHVVETAIRLIAKPPSPDSYREALETEFKTLYRKMNALRLEVDGSIVDDILTTVNKLNQAARTALGEKEVGG